MHSSFRLPALISTMSANADLWKMGHNQDFEAKDIGLGWLYYGLARTIKPSTAVVIGSWRGFAPMLIGQAIQDNSNGGKLIFIDPSFADDHWQKGVNEYFESYGIKCIQHFRQTSEAFLKETDLPANSVDLLFIDGYHTYDHCKAEHEGFSTLLSDQAVVLFHDSTSKMESTIYGQDNAYTHSVWRYIEELKSQSAFEVLNLPIGQGVAIARRAN